MPLPSLPTETWQAILRHAINVPGFLDPSSFEGDLEAPGFGDEDVSREDEGLYWETERTRNALRRVCMSWNLYLSQFNHRFVRMMDFWNGDVHGTSLKKAIRISFTSASCRLDRTRTDQLVSFRALPAEIVDLRGGTALNLWNSAVFRTLCNAKVIFAPDFERATDWPVFRRTPNVEYVRGILVTNFRSREWISRTLVTLSFKAMAGKCDDLIWNLPSLRHLRLDHDSQFLLSAFVSIVLLPLLRLVGHQLHSLYINTHDLTSVMPPELWELCPNLGKLYAGMRLMSPAPPSQPIHTLWIPSEHLYGTLHGNFTARSQWPNLVTAVINKEWVDMTSEKRRMLYMGWNQDSHTIWRDVNGITLEEAIRRDSATMVPLDARLAIILSTDEWQRKA